METIDIFEFYYDELSNDIVTYLLEEKINNVKVLFHKPGGDEIEKAFNKEEFEELKRIIEEIISDDFGADYVGFDINILSIQTKFEYYSDSLHITTSQKNVKEKFEKYNK